MKRGRKEGDRIIQTQLKKFQRELRQNMPISEVILWQAIRGKQLGVKFRRQYVAGNYILDFYAPKIKLAIEIDGETHFISPEIQEQDKTRDHFLENKGIKVLRFLNPDIMNNLNGVLRAILDEINLTPSLILPLGKGEEGGG